MLQSDVRPQPSPWRRELPQRRVSQGARRRCLATSRQPRRGRVPLRAACQGTAAEDGSALPCTRQADPEQLRDPAMIGGTASSTVHVQDKCGAESLDAYMRLPPEAYSQLMPKMILPLGGNRFLLRLPRISFFKVWVAPEVEVQARLVEGAQPCVLLESCSCRLPGSPLFASLEDRFALRFRTELSWSPARHSAGTAGGAEGDGSAAAASEGGATAGRKGGWQRSALPLALPRGLAGLFGQRSGSQAEPAAAASGRNSTSGDSGTSQEAAQLAPEPQQASKPRPQPSSNGSNGGSSSNGAGSNGSGGGGEGAAWSASLAAPSLLGAELAQDESADDKLGPSSPPALAEILSEVEAEGNSSLPFEGGKKGQGRIVGELVLEVWSEVPPPLHLLPRSVVEGTGNAVLRGLIRTLLPLFMRRLAEDYQLWAKDAAYRESKAQVAALGQAGQAASSPEGETEPEAAGEPVAR